MSRVAVIGSSPQLLVEAVRRARAGADVVVLEGRDDLGGAWTTTDFAGYRRVEVACHLLERDACGYGVLTGLGVELAAMTPQPRTVLRPGHSNPYTAPLTAAAQLAYYPVARVRQRGRLSREAWQRRRRLATRELIDSVADRSPVLGLVGGAGALVDTLVRRVEEGGAELRAGVRVERLCVGDGRPRLELRDEVIDADEVVLSAAFEPSRLVVDGNAAEGPVRRRSYAHRLLALPSGSVTPHSYIRFPRDPVLQRCSDVTHAAVPDDPARPLDLLLVSVRCDDDGAPLHELDDVVGRLRRHGIIGDVSPSDHRLMRYQGRDGAATLRAAVEGHDTVSVLDSFGDLTRALAVTGAPGRAAELSR